jgi:hypothetical protein
VHSIKGGSYDAESAEARVATEVARLMSFFAVAYVSRPFVVFGGVCSHLQNAKPLEEAEVPPKEHWEHYASELDLSLHQV